MISAEFRKSIESELKRLTQSRANLIAEIDEAIRKLENLLLTDRNSVPTSNVTTNTAKSSDVTAPSFAAVVESALAAYPDGLRPIEVSKYLEQRGVQINGNTSLSNRVAGELVRLYARKRLERNNGVYRLAKS